MVKEVRFFKWKFKYLLEIRESQNLAKLWVVGVFVSGVLVVEVFRDRSV